MEEEIKKEETPTERAEKAIQELKEENDRAERLRTDKILSGDSGGYVAPEKPKEISNVEYAQKLMRGEVNPLKEDGIML